MWNARLKEAQAGIKIAGRNINNLRYADDTTLMAESKKKVGLKLNIQQTKIMASGPITSWQIDGETAETVTNFILGGSKITADGNCNHEIKRHLLLGRKVMLDRILKSRDITLQTKFCLVKAVVFPVVMYGCESWTIKKAECRRTDAFELWCWKRLLRVPLTARSNQSILKEIISEYSLEGLMLKLKLQYFGHLMWRNSLDKTLMLAPDIQPRPHIKTETLFCQQRMSSQSCGFPSSHVWMWELGYKESWALKIWCYLTVVLEKTLESPLDCKETQPVHPKGNQY